MGECRFHCMTRKSGEDTDGATSEHAGESESSAKGTADTREHPQADNHDSGQGKHSQPDQRGSGEQATGPGQGASYTDVFSRSETKPLIKTALAFYIACGVGIGLSLFITASTFGGGLIGVAMTRIIVFAGLISALAIGPALGGPLGFYVVQRLSGRVDDQQLYATAAAGAFGGHICLVLVVVVMMSAGLSGGGGGLDIGEALVPIVVGGVGAGIAAAGTAYAVRTYVSKSTARVTDVTS